MFTKTKLYILGFIAICLSLLMVATLNIPDRNEPKDGPYGSTEYPPSALAASKGCGGIFVFDKLDNKYWGLIPDELKQAHEADNVPQQPVNIPSIGFISPTPIDKAEVGVYDYTFGGYDDPKINRILWEGYNIIWYSLKMPKEDVLSLRDYVISLNKAEPTTFLLPYRLAGREIPFSRDVAFSSWGSSQSCKIFDTRVYQNFLSFTAKNAPNNGGEPPLAPLDKYNELYQQPEEKR